jgi:predicted nucleic acid-binding protein
VGKIRQGLQGKTVYFDANIFIYTLEAIEPWDVELNDVFSGLLAGEFTAVTSSLSLTECLVLPFRLNNRELVKTFREALLPSYYLDAIPISDKILLSTANIRAKTNLKLPDAIHAATALTQKCSVMLTNDAGFKRVPNIDVFLLSDWITPSC